MPTHGPFGGVSWQNGVKTEFFKNFVFGSNSITLIYCGFVVDMLYNVQQVV